MRFLVNSVNYGQNWILRERNLNYNRYMSTSDFSVILTKVSDKSSA